jgi:hypothetical protein
MSVATSGHTFRSLRSNQGDCLSGQSDDSLRKVSCASSSAQWTVVGVAENKTLDEAKAQACAPWPNAQASYWESSSGKTGFVLCLAATGKKAPGRRATGGDATGKK